MKGLVSLVGSGPGDPGLLTLQAKRRIQEADLIIYDYLANPEHLLWAKPTCKRIGVGKGFRHKKISQDRIHRLILESSIKGHRIVRLKGGDPYLFGRGGEEALYLHEKNIPFEVVPGVTSATACAAYAGVPLTHRDHNGSVVFLTGHRADDKGLDSIPWKSIVSIGGSVVIYMGIYNLPLIAKGLLGAGMSDKTPVCIVQWGTLPQQRSCQGALRNIVNITRRAGLEAPSIIIIGDVVQLRSKLNWYETLPFFGRGFLVARPVDKIGRLSERLSGLGGQVYSYASVEIRPTRDFTDMDKALRDIQKFDWVVFTSTYGVDVFFERLASRFGFDARALSRVKIACVGPETAQALKKYGIEADLQPHRHESIEIVRALRKMIKTLKGLRFLLPRTSIAPRDLEREITRLGGQAQRITAYRTLPVKKMPLEVREALLSGKINAVLFTSASAVESFVRALGSANLRKIPRCVSYASIGPVTSQAVKKAGLRVACEAKRYTLDGLVEAVKNVLS